MMVSLVSQLSDGSSVEIGIAGYEGMVGVSPDDALNSGRRIRQQGKQNGHKTLVVMAEKYGADVEGTNVNVGHYDWITTSKTLTS